MENIEDQDLKRFAEKKIESLRKELRKWYSLLEAIEESNPTGSQADLFDIDSNKTDVKTNNSNPRIKENPMSLRERCEKIVYDLDEPLTTRDLKKILEQRYGKKYNFYSFSGSFSQAYRRKNSLIKKYDLEEPTTKVIAVYGLKDWFNPLTGELKNEYKEKLIKRYGTK